MRSSLMIINYNSFIHLMTYTIDFSTFNNKIYLVLVINIVISHYL